MTKPVRGRPTHWSVLIVPHGSCDGTKEIVVSRRTLGILRRTSTVVGIVLGVLTLSTVAMASRGDVMMPGVGVAANQAELDSLRAALVTITQREARIRLLAGLPPLDSVAPARQVPAAGWDVSTLLRRAEDLASSFAEVSDSLEVNSARLASLPSIMPTSGWLTSQFSQGRKHPVLHVSRPHEGIDVAAPMGTAIIAPAAGVIRRVANERGYGLVLEIDHGNGIVTRFAHQSRVIVKEGDRVTRGQHVGNVGNSGLSTGPHLHYEIHVNGRVVDPLTYVMPGAIPD
jgi:murein DD-endopeptidase MepM/ murein hydrolase activator NlpD